MAPLISDFWKVVIFSWVSVPVVFGANFLFRFLMRGVGFDSKLAVGMGFAVFGITMLVSCVAVGVKIFKKGSKNAISDPYFYCFALFAFTCIIDLGIGLELDGFISEFTTIYLESGEPYLASAYGAVICYWDGFGLYAMYLYMVHRILNKKSYRSMALYLTGNLANSMIVLIVSIILGKYGPLPATTLNIPYFILPFVMGWTFLRDRPAVKIQGSAKPLLERPLDLAFIAFFIFAICVAVIRGLAVLEHHLWLPKFYLNEIEPILGLSDPCPFPKLQMLVYLFYMFPVYLMSIHALIRPGCTWMQDLTLIHAGAALQAQVCHIGSTFHNLLDKEFHLPEAVWAKVTFWAVNLILLIVPQLLLLRCFKSNVLFSAKTISPPSSPRYSKKIK